MVLYFENCADISIFNSSIVMLSDENKNDCGVDIRWIQYITYNMTITVLIYLWFRSSIYL